MSSIPRMRLVARWRRRGLPSIAETVLALAEMEARKACMAQGPELARAVGYIAAALKGVMRLARSAGLQVPAKKD